MALVEIQDGGLDQRRQCADRSSHGAGGNLPDDYQGDTLYLKQASSFLYAELLGATSGVQMEVILEVEDRNGFEAWRRLVQ